MCVVLLLPSLGGEAVSAEDEPGESLSWVTFLGDDSYDEAGGVAVDSDGYVYVTGETQSAWTDPEDPTPVRPHSSGDYEADAWVAKLDSAGDIVWYTFFGGEGIDIGCAIVVDEDCVYVTGRGDNYAWSQPGDSSPVRAHAAGYDAFVAVLDIDTGVLQWHTFLGGSNTDVGDGIAVDGDGNIYVAGISEAAWAETPARAYSSGKDVFAAALSPAGALTWHTFLGGSGDECEYGQCGIAVDAGGVVVVGDGVSDWGSGPVRTYSGGRDAFVARLDADDGDLSRHTFLGGPDGYCGDCGHDIALDGDGAVYITGKSDASWGAPLDEHHGDNDAFVAKLTSDLSLTWHTFLGGSSSDYGNAIAVDSSGQVYAAGSSGGTWGSPEHAYSGTWNVFAARVSESGSLNWNTFVGGDSDIARAAAVDDSGNLTISGDSSSGGWATGPVRAYSDWYDGLVVQLATPAAEEPDIVEGDANGDGATNIIDAMFIAQYAVGLRTFDATQLLCADTTDDGMVNIIDAMHVAQFSVDPTGAGGVLYKQLWETPADDALLNPLSV
jgi:hypothetical protein